VTAIAATMQAFFTERLIAQRRASPHTITAYRDTLRLLLGFAAERTRISPCRLDIADLDAPLIAAFLDHIEHQRGNSIRTRNARLAAVRSLFAFAALRHPEHAADIARVLAIPAKRGDQAIVTSLTDPEAEALLAAPDPATRTGRRDHAWIQLAIQTGLRASELTALTCRDVRLGPGAYVACHGKGRKDRITPLTPATVTTLRAWLAERAATPGDPLFPTSRRADEPRRPATAAQPPRHRGQAVLSVPDQQKRHPSCPASHRSDAVAARRGRHHCHHTVARTRIGQDYSYLPRRGPGAQRAGAEPHQPARQHARPLPAPRRSPRLPRSPVVMPNSAPRSPP
jgi:integrase/recombinase XerD